MIIRKELYQLLLSKENYIILHLGIMNVLSQAIKEGYNNTALSKLIAHLMYNNYEFSKKRVYMIMEVVNDGISLSEAKNTFELLFNVLLIEDRYTQVRLEWIFSIPQMVVKTNDANYPTLPAREIKYGDKIIRFISPLLYGTYHDALVERILYKYHASSDYIIILNYFFSTIYKKAHIFHYFDCLPHPRNDTAPLHEYVFQLANE